MADTDTETLHNGTGGISAEEEERLKQRPADIDADVREMERRKRVEALMSSRLFREELERVLDQQLSEGGDAPLLQRIKEMVGGRLQSGSFRGPSCVLPINDIRGMEGVGYEKGEKILRCKLAAVYRLVDLFGWTQSGISGQITARLNTAVEQVLTTPRGLLPHEVTASSLTKVDMQGTVQEQGTTNFPVNVAGFSLHASVHAARPDVRCVLHIRSPAALAVSAMRNGLLPLCNEAALLGDISYHHVPPGILDNEERDKLVRALGPSAKVLVLTNGGVLCCGETLEEAFFQAKNLTTACDVQLRLASIPLEALSLLDQETRKQIYDASRRPPAEGGKWRVGGEEFEALMRMLDNAGFRTGYIYRHPLVKYDVPKPKNDVEVPPAVSSLGYLLEEEEMYKQGFWKKGGVKTGERTRWLNSPNVYQKVEVLETGTTDPKKITKWVDANNEEWVQDGSPGHSSTPVKIDAALQFVPKNTNPKEFKKLQQQIKENRRADKISAGPQSHILEGVTWDEAAKLAAEDAHATHTGDHVVLMGAASKGIIQRGFQHNATMYASPYARNPFDHITDREIDEYKRTVEKKQRGEYDTDLSESEAISGAQIMSPASETEEESRDEHRVLRIETKQAPVRSQPEVVLSDGGNANFLSTERAYADRTRGAKLMLEALTAPANCKTTKRQSPSRSSADPVLAINKNRHDYSRTRNFSNIVKAYETVDAGVRTRTKTHPKCKVSLDSRLVMTSDSLKGNTVDVYNPGNVSSRSSLNSIPSIEWDAKGRFDYQFKTMSLPRGSKPSVNKGSLFRTHSHAGFLNSHLKNPEPVHYHLPKCRSCGASNNSYVWELSKTSKSNSRVKVSDSVYYSLDNVKRRHANATISSFGVVEKSTINSVPNYDVEKVVIDDANSEFVESQEFTEDCYIGDTWNRFSSDNLTVIETEPVDFNDNGKQRDKSVAVGSKSELEFNEESCTESHVKDDETRGRIPKYPSSDDLTLSKKDNKNVDAKKSSEHELYFVSYDETESRSYDLRGKDNNADLEGLYQADCVNVDPDDNEGNKKTFTCDTVYGEYLNFSNDLDMDETRGKILKYPSLSKKEALKDNKNVDPEKSSEHELYFVSYDETESRSYDLRGKDNNADLEGLYQADCVNVDPDENEENNKTFTSDTVYGEYLNFSNDLDMDEAAYDSPVRELIEKDIRNYTVPIHCYWDDYVNGDISCPVKSPHKLTETLKPMEPILEETKTSLDSSSGQLSTNDRTVLDVIVLEGAHVDSRPEATAEDANVLGHISGIEALINDVLHKTVVVTEMKKEISANSSVVTAEFLKTECVRVFDNLETDGSDLTLQVRPSSDTCFIETAISVYSDYKDANEPESRIIDTVFNNIMDSISNDAISNTPVEVSFLYPTGANAVELCNKEDKSSIMPDNSVTSSNNELISFNSTAEFEIFEAIGEILGIIMDRINYEVNSSLYGMFAKNLASLSTQDIDNDVAVSGTGNDIVNISDATNKPDNSILLSEISKTDQKFDDADTMFSITKLIEELEDHKKPQPVLSDSEATDVSDVDTRSNAHKIVEAIIYFVFDKVFVLHAAKVAKFVVKKAKQVVTVVDAEDILFTSMHLWNEVAREDPIMIDELDVYVEVANEDKEASSKSLTVNDNDALNTVSDIVVKIHESLETKVNYASGNHLQYQEMHKLNISEEKSFEVYPKEENEFDLTVVTESFYHVVVDNVVVATQKNIINEIHEDTCVSSVQENNLETLQHIEMANTLACKIVDDVFIEFDVGKDIEGRDTEKNFGMKDINQSNALMCANILIDCVITEALEKSFRAYVDHTHDTIHKAKSVWSLNETCSLENDDGPNTVEDMNMAFVADISADSRVSSELHDNSRSFNVSCEDSVNRHEHVHRQHQPVIGSPYHSQSSILSMSQIEQRGGIKYWVSFDDSFMQRPQTIHRPNRRQNEDKMPSFLRFGEDDATDIVDWANRSKYISRHRLLPNMNLTAGDELDKTFVKNNRLDDNDSFESALASRDAASNENSDVTVLTKDAASEHRDMTARPRHSSWPTYEDTLFYRILSKFRMSESFDPNDVGRFNNSF